MFILEVKEVFTYINVSKPTKWRIKPDYFSIYILFPFFSVTIIINNLTYIIPLNPRNEVHRG